jgi:hypothetical protein
MRPPLTSGLDRGGIEPVLDDGGHLEDLGAQQHEQPTDVSRRQARDPRVGTADAQRCRGACHRRLDRRATEFDEAGLPRRARRSDDHGDTLGHGFAGREDGQLSGGVEEGGRLRSIDQPSAFVLTQPYVQRQEWHAVVPTSVYDLDPRRTGWEFDREQFSGGQTERRLHGPERTRERVALSA